MRREVVHTDDFLNDLKGLFGGSDELVERFCEGLDFILQNRPETVGVQTLDPDIYLTFAEAPVTGADVTVYYQFDPITAPSTDRKVYVIAAVALGASSW